MVTNINQPNQVLSSVLTQALSFFKRTIVFETPCMHSNQQHYIAANDKPRRERKWWQDLLHIFLVSCRTNGASGRLQCISPLA